MDATTWTLLWAQAANGTTGASAGGTAGGGLSNPAALASLALRRWFAGLTLCSPQAIPDLHGLWAFVAGLAGLLVLAMVFQGPLTALQQLLDVGAHISLARRATGRVWKAGRLVAAAITFTVLAWTGGQTMSFLGERPEKGRADLTVLSRSRARGELALDQGLLAALTPLRDVAGLADNLPLLLCAVYLVFRASAGTLAPAGPVEAGLGEKPSAGRWAQRPRTFSGWSNVIWGCGALYALYRVVARFSGSAELPLGGCLVIEALVIPLIMMVCDGFLLAWILAELRDASFDNLREDRFHPAFAFDLMPAAALGCALALPARYVATLVMLTYQHLPTSVISTPVGSFIRWQLGWGLIDLQALSLVFLGLVGVTAWTRGSLADALSGYARLLRRQGGHLVAALAMAGAASCLLGALIYPVMLLLPPAGWVLSAADSYSHYLTLPVGLWTLAALIDLAQRSLPAARPAAAGDDRVTLAATPAALHDPGEGLATHSGGAGAAAPEAWS
jgi:hypothetical protein